MKIIVCVKQVPATNKVDIDPVTGTLKRAGVSSKLNPYDLFAVEAAIELAEKTDGSVTALSMGPPPAAGVLEECIWMGADAGLLLSDRAFGGADVAATGYCLSLGVRSLGDCDLILCGKQTTDGDTAQVGPELAEFLGIGHATNVLSIDRLEEDAVTVTVDLDGIEQTQRMKLPCLLTIEKDANTPRLPSYLRRRASRPEQIRICAARDLPDADLTRLGLKGSPTNVERIFPPAVREGQPLQKGTSDELAASLYGLLKAEKYV